jgi:hypothetical protein
LKKLLYHFADFLSILRAAFFIVLPAPLEYKSQEGNSIFEKYSLSTVPLILIERATASSN